MVDCVATHFGFILDAIFEIKHTSTAPNSALNTKSLAIVLKGPCSVKHALTYYADLLGPPSKIFLGYIANTVIDPVEKNKLLLVVEPSEEGNMAYLEFIKTYRTILDVSMKYGSANSISLLEFLIAVNVMIPRRYSISSSPLVSPQSVHLVSLQNLFQNRR